MKILFVKIAAAAAGVTLALCVAAATLFWYTTRPKPPKSWDTKALTTMEPPSFVPTSERHVLLHCEVKNQTSNDYSVGENNQLRLIGRIENGRLTRPLDNAEYFAIATPVFIPAQQTGTLSVEVKTVTLVPKEAKQSDDDYHEQIRDVLNQGMSGLEGFTIFDEQNRYQIDLPKRRATKLSDTSAQSAKPR
jgi:hypothetical protein